MRAKREAAVEATGAVSSGERSSSTEQNPSLTAPRGAVGGRLPKARRIPGLAQSREPRTVAVTHRCWGG